MLRNKIDECGADGSSFAYVSFKKVGEALLLTFLSRKVRDTTLPEQVFYL